jgi:photosystem II stability/assembly factor-like uncharacterized protein
MSLKIHSSRYRHNTWISLSAFSFLIPALILTTGIKTAYAFVFWQKTGEKIDEPEIYCMALHPKINSWILIGTRYAIYESRDGGLSWSKLYRLKTEKKAVNQLWFDLQSDAIFAATGNGIYAKRSSRDNWEHIFSGKGETEKYCHCVVNQEGIILAGTQAGLWVSRDKGQTWLRQPGLLGKVSVILLKTGMAPYQNFFYALTTQQLFLSRDYGNSWEEVLTIPRAQTETTADEEENNGDEEDPAEDTSGPEEFADLAIASPDAKILYVASNKNIRLSLDAGKSWQVLKSSGLASSGIKTIVYSQKDYLLASTKTGIYRYGADVWRLVAAIPAPVQKRGMLEDGQGSLWLATAHGLYKSHLLPDDNIATDTDKAREQFFIYLKTHEPCIEEVMKEAIRYAELGEEKIKSWRRRASIKALFPEFTLDYDKTVATSLAATYERAMVGPRDWSVGMKWDVGELIWNSEQTSIDVRSRLMVELRDDILNEVTHFYFERQRLLAELFFAPAADLKVKIEQELRLRELTANIDALTGGYFSKRLHELKIRDGNLYSLPEQESWETETRKKEKT